MRAEVGAAGVHPAARLPGAVQFIVGWPVAGMDSKTQRAAERRLNSRRLLGPAVDDTMTSRLAVRRDGLPADTDRTLAFYLWNAPAATG